jgi:outer membrane murein-binding lipoprotein Lpp
MKKGIMFLVLAAFAFSFAAAGCRSEAKVDEDGAKLEIKGND